MRRVLRLWRLELDFEGFLFFVDVEFLSERLISLGVYLNQNLALRDRRNGGYTFLIGLQLPTGADLFAQLHHRPAFDELDQDAGPVDRLVFDRAHLDAQPG